MRPLKRSISAVHPLHPQPNNPSNRQKKSFFFHYCLLSRSFVHHDAGVLVEGVRHHAGQLPAALHHQIPEAEVLASQLLQTLLLNVPVFTRHYKGDGYIRLFEADARRQNAGCDVTSGISRAVLCC